MRFKLFATILMFLILVPFTAALASPFFIGNNLSPGTETPPKSTWTVGSYIIGYAPTDTCLIGTNAWMAWDYNSYSAIARCKLTEETRWFDESSFQLAYIQSDKSLGDAYRQTVGIVWWTMKHKFNDLYSLYTTLNFMHFWDETVPFSLRRDPGNDQPYQFSLTTLQRVSWTETAGFAFEFGILGLNYEKPLVHNGYSVYKMTESFLFQAGLSISAAPNNFNRLYSRPDARGRAKDYDYSVHPEIQLQYFF
jgi:hypothetical protein